MVFSLHMIQPIMQCVKSVSFSILVNGVSKGFIVLSGGLRQEESLSPYIFLLCIEDLVNLVKKSALTKCLEGVRVYRGTPMINHLLFADNSLIFCQTNQEASHQLLALLKQYALASGQYIIAEKTTIVFSRNVQENAKDEIMAIWVVGVRHNMKNIQAFPYSWKI